MNVNLNQFVGPFWRRDTKKLLSLVLMAGSCITVILLILARFSPWSISISAIFRLWGFLAIGSAIAAFILFRRLQNRRYIAQRIETYNPELTYKIRTALDFEEGKTDIPESELSHVYQEGVQNLLNQQRVFFQASQLQKFSLALCVAFAGIAFVSWQSYLGLPKSNNTLAFGNTLLNFDGGSITVFEPEYTNIPGRTLALKPGRFEAFAGSRIQFSVLQQNNLKRLFYSGLNEEIVEIPQLEGGGFNFEFLLMENTEIQFLVSNDANSGKTQPFVFQVKPDKSPVVELKRYTDEGTINVFDPLLIDASVKDDFLVAQLEAVVNWDQGEKRLKLNVPNNQRKHFLSRNRWNLSDLVPEDTTRFTIYLEAKDNNPVNGPGYGQSKTLTYELESPDQKHDEFMALARELLDRITHTLGDNLESYLGPERDTYIMMEAHRLSEQIERGLMDSQSLAAALLGMMRQDPYITQIDREFLLNYRSSLSRAYTRRAETNRQFASVSRPQGRLSQWQDIRDSHRFEEINLEKLTYELLLQLKLWALLELERSQDNLEKTLENLENMLDQAQNQDQQQVEQQVRKMLENIMKEFQEMMAKAAQEMERSIDEFMNSEAMQTQKDALEELIKEITEAIKEGDMEKAKALMEEFKAQMMSAMEQMQQSMGQMSPEMKAMMESLREMNGLLQELKLQEEELEAATQEMRQEIDKEIGNELQPSEQERQQQRALMENIKRMLSELNVHLSELQDQNSDNPFISDLQEQRDDWTKRILKLSQELDNPELSQAERFDKETEIRNLEFELGMNVINQIERLQELTLKSLESTENMQNYLDQGELMPSLEMGYKLEKQLLTGEAFSVRRVSRIVQDEAKPKETFEQSKLELQQILQMLNNLKQGMEQKREQFMSQKKESNSQKLAQKQQTIRQMIDQFKQAHNDQLGSSPLFDKLNDIGRAMDNAGRNLKNRRLDGGIRYEQDALRQIGELMEQMQQTQQGQGSPYMMGMGFGQQQEGMNGNPIRDIAIPESQHEAQKQQLREMIRKQMQKSLPDQYGKEIKKYYERLIDQ